MQLKEMMSLVDHLSELRTRIIRVLIVLVLTMIGGFFAAQKILLYFKETPPASSMSWHVFSPMDGIRIYMMIAFVISLTITLPFILFQVWGFVKAGLTKEEQSATLRYIPYTFLCFMIGLSFAYFVVFPMCMTFTIRITENLGLTQTYGVAQYFSFMLNIVLPLSIAFELPIVVMFLTRIKLLNPKLLHKFRRYAYLVLVITASLISPPDLISHLMVALPLFALYEISVVLSRFVFNAQNRENNKLNAEATATS
ncbi:twin-arginine translocase subunit TatC [Paenibacillus aceris]|uniref:Sec-independent protein translocase protein TatC n=1 Tax=Paenibacillus aceris TaxID=869555 RepID=A0ABS4HSK9_9BACL|nr:twin-arginine translocase subunit TatC [Paenibacillus aceris]MBP1961593.1 sec-independent protein translocase protein TatC [Paenibacillus aceris]NHW37634.1 twin-arginine translocase subunit TatC [Paenibacillus aceris]